MQTSVTIRVHQIITNLAVSTPTDNVLPSSQPTQNSDNSNYSSEETK